jgi:hypothetical protein
MFQFLLNRMEPRRRRTQRTAIGHGIETYELRTLLSATSAVAAEVCVEHVNHPAPATPIHVASLANFNGDWQIAAGSALHFTQSGGVVTGTQTVLSTTVANFSGQVHGRKLTGDLTSIGIDAHSTIKVKLTDATHFTGKRHFFVNGASHGTQPITGVQL